MNAEFARVYGRVNILFDIQLKNVDVIHFC